MATPVLVVCGTITLDTIERAGVCHADLPGGSALYASAAAAPLVPVRLLGTIGSDCPSSLREHLEARGIDGTAVEQVEGSTFRWHARYADDGETRMTVRRDRGVAEGRLPPIPPSPAGPHTVCLASTDPQVQRAVCDAHPHARLTGLDSMAHWWHSQADLVRALLPRVQVLFVDREEMALGTGTTDPADGIAALHGLGPELVILKAGAAGATLARRGQAPLHGPVDAARPVVDTTGAGDAFAGALLAALSLGHPDADALAIATATAARAVAGWGLAGLRATPGLPSQPRVASR